GRRVGGAGLGALGPPAYRRSHRRRSVSAASRAVRRHAAASTWAREPSVGIDDGYDSFYRAEYPHVVRTSYLIVHDRQRSEDVAQEAFIQLLTHWRKVSRYEQPGAWVRRVAIRLASRAARREQRRPSVEHGSDP